MINQKQSLSEYLDVPFTSLIPELRRLKQEDYDFRTLQREENKQ